MNIIQRSTNVMGQSIHLCSHISINLILMYRGRFLSCSVFFLVLGSEPTYNCGSLLDVNVTASLLSSSYSSFESSWRCACLPGGGNSRMKWRYKLQEMSRRVKHTHCTWSEQLGGSFVKFALRRCT